MTTTLRPTGPEKRTEDGTRSRTYDICVNSRPVGTVRLVTDARLGTTSLDPTVGRIDGISIKAPDRRKGRATIAALTAEEVLRDWGCRQIAVTVPAEAEPALRLAEVLGYTERSRTVAKELSTAPELPTGSVARPLEGAEFTAWLAAEKATYARSWADHGLSRAAAEAKSEADHGRLLPEGADTPDAVLRVLTHEGTDVGTLWATVRMPGEIGGYVLDVEVAEEYRGHGHGRTLMQLAERECLAAGVRALGLNVFAENTPVLRLYTSLGYRTTLHHLHKPLI
jgi:ribosomal protein S18 acetylase RimI-like enzyme